MSYDRHKCDGTCFCPIHGLAFYYSRSIDEHACPNVYCKYGHGYESVVGNKLIRNDQDKNTSIKKKY